jgi:hypothetical protein
LGIHEKKTAPKEENVPIMRPFEFEWSSYFLIWAATKKHGWFDMMLESAVQTVLVQTLLSLGGGIRTQVGTCFYYETYD